MTIQFKKATREQAKLRLALVGPSGSGKTYTALAIADGLGDKVAVIDTEHGSASKYAGDPYEFDVLELQSFHPQQYIDAIEAADRAGYDVVIVDSLSHAWEGKDGALEQVDKAAKRPGENSFTAWRDVTPLHRRLVETILGSGLHVIVTMRVKTEYVLEPNERGKMVPRKVGLAPIQRQGVEYEFDVVADIDLDHNFTVTKTRCRALDGAVINKAGGQVADRLRDWLTTGEPATPPEPYATDERAGEIMGLISTLAQGKQAGIAKALERIEAEFGTRDLKRLRESQANEIADRLLARIHEQEDMAAAAQTELAAEEVK